ncbi:MAG: DUF1415 domain-containing protein [Pseudomonadota bacterium]
MRDSESSDVTSINAVRRWLETVVIAQEFCPFAQREFERGSIAYEASQATSIAGALEDLGDCLSALENDIEIETLLLIFDQGFDDFEQYLDLYFAAEELLASLGFESVYQIASFHPEYQFADAPADDPANFTNRSPHPVLHLLRESSVSRAVDQHPDINAIPKDNIERARELGHETLASALARCYDV